MAEYIRSIQFTLTVDTNKYTYDVTGEADSLDEVVEKFKAEVAAISASL